MPTPEPRNHPHTHCPRCHEPFGSFDEDCGHCGLAPLALPEDAIFYDAAIDIWRDANPGAD